MSFLHSSQSYATMPSVKVFCLHPRSETSWFLFSSMRGWTLAFQTTTAHIKFEIHDLLLAIHSSLRKGHSIETLPSSDVFGAIDCCQLTLLALYDVSVLFDTMDHEILLEHLHLFFGLSGTKLTWLRSFFSERSMCVVHGLSRSSWAPAPMVSPRIFLGPLLYIIYTSDIASLLAHHASQLYAYDVQAYQQSSTAPSLTLLWLSVE